jgi:predicted O-methyltransferase YrrM
VANFFQLKSYLHHWLHTVSEHSIHSPFFYEFYTQAIRGKSTSEEFTEIEKTRIKLLQTHTEIEVKDLGAPSKHFKSNKRTIAQVASTSLSPAGITQFLHRAITHLDAKNIVELGTSLGVTTLYLSKNKNTIVHTFEGNPSIADIALTNFEYFNASNIHLIQGNIDETLPLFLENPSPIDFVLMDANHQHKPTIHYFNMLTKRIAPRGAIIIDDIYNSDGMGQAWGELKKHPLVYGSIDLFRCGILFFDPALNKQHYVCSL